MEIFPLSTYRRAIWQRTFGTSCRTINARPALFLRLRLLRCKIRTQMLPMDQKLPELPLFLAVICPNSARLRVLISSAVCANFSYGFLCKPTQNFPASVQQENGALPILCHVFPQSSQIALHQRHIGLSPRQFLRGDVVAAVEHGGSGPCGLRNGVRHQMVGKLDIPDGGDML